MSAFCSFSHMTNVLWKNYVKMKRAHQERTAYMLCELVSFVCLLFACGYICEKLLHHAVVSHRARWKGLKWSKVCFYSEMQVLPVTNSHKGQTKELSFLSRRELRSGLPSITKSSSLQTGWREFSDLN